MGEKKKDQSRILYPVKTSFRNKGEIQTFSVMQKQKRVIISSSALQKNVKENSRSPGGDLEPRKGRKRGGVYIFGQVTV